MKLVLINNGHNPKCEEYLLMAAAKRRLETKVVNSRENIFKIKAPEKHIKTLIYRIAIVQSEILLERIYLGRGAISFFASGDAPLRASNKLFCYENLQKADVPIPPTIFSNATSDVNLKKVVRELGLPLVIKTLNGTRGDGTLVVDSFFALKSTVQLLVTTKIDFVLQQLIREAAGRHVRVIILGDEILCAYQKSIPRKVDFRSNATEKAHRKIVKLDSETQKFVLRAAAASGVEFGGIDLLPASKGYLIAEVNSPCNFAASQDFTGIDIAGKILDFLITKAKRKK